MIRLLRVSGSSMEPAYQDGDFVVIVRHSFFLNGFKPGDVVVFHHKGYGTLIKQVKKVEYPEVIHTVGTNSRSVDSRHFGPIKAADVIGKVIFHVPAKQRHRKGKVPR